MDDSLWEIVKDAAIVLGTVIAFVVGVTKVKDNDVSAGWKKRRRGPGPRR